MKLQHLHPKGARKLMTGHPWITRNEILEKKDLPKRPAFQFLGEHWWAISPESHLTLRRFGPIDRNWMAAPEILLDSETFRKKFGPWLTEHFADTLRAKMASTLLPDDDLVLRWIFSENDLIPGLIIDIYKDLVACHLNSAPMELAWPALQNAIAAAYTKVTGKTARILAIRESATRTAEGLEVIPHEGEHPVTDIRWNGFRWRVSPTDGQKTGTYLDQKFNHSRTADFARRLGAKTAWDVFSYQGGFSLHLLRAGLDVLAVDQSASALKTLEHNVAANDLPAAKLTTLHTDAFAWLRDEAEKLTKPDLIVLDPPSMLKSAKEREDAARGFYNLNLRALKILPKSGFLVTCVCSHNMTRDLMRSTLQDAAHKSRREIQVLEVSGPSPDHAPSVFFPEGEYLQAWYLQMMN